MAGEAIVPHTPKEIAAHDRGEPSGMLDPSRWTDIYKPIIAAVNGVVYAGGLEGACFADIRIAEKHASFGVTCRRWNIGLGDGGTQRLPRIAGRANRSRRRAWFGMMNQIKARPCCLITIVAYRTGIPAASRQRRGRPVIESL
jgi:enoyl-CoA hydratase/carnithine racemase